MPASSRVVATDDISIRSGGDGRTVVAYAAIFNSPTHIVDQDGEYQEQIGRHAFDKSLTQNRDRIFSVYNHAKTLHGTPSDQGSVPIGRTVDIRADSKGLLTVTRMNEGQWGDSILDAIKSGSLRGMSFTGVFVKSDPPLRPGQQYRRDARGNLPLVTRQEIGLVEYGPTPIPAYPGAEVVGVRHADGTLRPPALRWTADERLDWMLKAGVSSPATDRLMRAHADDGPPEPSLEDRLECLDDMAAGRTFYILPDGRLAHRWCPFCTGRRTFAELPGGPYVCDVCYPALSGEFEEARRADEVAMVTARTRQALADARRSR